MLEDATHDVFYWNYKSSAISWDTPPESPREEEEAGAGQDPIALDLLDREKAAFERLAGAMAVHPT